MKGHLPWEEIISFIDWGHVVCLAILYLASKSTFQPVLLTVGFMSWVVLDSSYLFKKVLILESYN
jgi:hypothetical protein